ncbi:MAG TPA: PEP-CTERM sorting domain-containing protein [Casimicrobiaceae bacterium]|nr:PEP-CTERM sorting domain-containing protein [Casimicrobiaceae bacterium]
MSKKSRRVSSTAVLSTLSLLVGASAQAGHYPGANDPGGNGTVPGFTGRYIFTIDDNCFTLGNGTFSTQGNGACGAATVYSGNVNLYSTASDTPPLGSVLGTFDLTSNPPDFWPIFDVVIFGGQLVGLDTGSMGPNPGTGSYTGTNFWLEITSGGTPGLDPAFISLDNFVNTISNPGVMVYGPECTDLATCTVNIPSAPEPGSLGLLFAAFGGAWLARRRARKSAEAQ